MLSRYQVLEDEIQNISHCIDPEKRAILMKEFSSLGKVVSLYKEYKNIQKEIKNYNKDLLEEKKDKELITLIKEELEGLTLKQNNLLEDLKNALVEVDPLDEKNIIMEIRPAAGGDEASLFCKDLFVMYSNYATKNNWQVEMLSSSVGNLGGFKEIIFSISGHNVYAKMKYESGVHRVQRVPKTETQGRVHTSTVTVAVLPSVDAKVIKVDPVDVRIDTFRSSGAGGQHVNTTDSAVRVVHLPSKIMVQCQDEKSQHANKEKAMKVLYARLYDMEIKKRKEEESKKRLSQIGTGDRSEKVRTYNFPQSRVTDHRTGLTMYDLEHLMTGDMSSIIESLKNWNRNILLTAEEYN